MRAASCRVFCRRGVILSGITLVLTTAAAADETSTWFGGTGNWGTASNWINSPPVNEYPNNGNAGLLFDASVGGGTATLDQDIIVDALSLSGGTISGNKGLELLTGGTWSGGTISNRGFPGGGTLTIGPNASFTIAGGSAPVPKLLLFGWTLNNSGTINFSPSGFYGFNMDAGAVLNNSGNFNVVSDGSLFGPESSLFGGGVINNSGTFSKTGGNGISYFNVDFSNSGTVNVASGALELGGAGTQTGSFNIAARTALTFGGKNTFQIFAPASSVTGDGIVEIDGEGGLELDGTYNVGTTRLLSTFSNNSAQITVQAPAKTASLSVLGGTLSLSGPLGSMNGLSAPVVLGSLGTLEFDNSTASGGNIVGGTRLSPVLPIVCNGGTIRILGADNDHLTQIFPGLIMNAGATGVSLVPGQNGSITATFRNTLAPVPGMTFNFTASDPGGTSKVFFAGTPASSLLGGWAFVNGNTFAKYDPSRGVVPLTQGDYTDSIGAGGNVRLVGSASTAGDASVNTLTLDASAASVNLGLGGLLTVARGGLLHVGTNVGINAPVASISGGAITSGTTDLTIYDNGSPPLTISSRITGSINLVKSGRGVVILNGPQSNDYTGTTYVNEGALELNSPGNTPIPGNVVISGGLLQEFAPNQIRRGASITVNTGHVILADGTVVGNITLENGSLVVPRTVFAGVATLRTGGAVELAGGSTASFNQLVINGDSSIGDQSITPVTAARPNAVLNPDEVITGGGGLVFTGKPQMTLSLLPGVSNRVGLSLTGDVIVNADVSKALIRTVLPISGTADGVLDLNGAQRTFTINSPSANPNLLTVSSAIVDSSLSQGGSLRKDGGGTLELSGENTYSAGTVIVSGVLQVDNPQALGSGPVQFAGDGILKLNISGGTRQSTISVPNPVSAAASDSIGLDTGTSSYELAHPQLGSRVNVRGSPGGSLTISGNLALHHDLTIDNSVPVMIDGGVSGPYKLFKVGVGELTLGGAIVNSYTGGTEVDGGALVLNNAGGPLPGALTVNGPAAALVTRAGQLGGPIILDSTAGTSVLTFDATDPAGRVQQAISLEARGGNTAVIGRGAGSATLSVGSLTLGSSDHLDLTGNSLRIAYGSRAAAQSIRTLVSSGYDRGTWDGPGIDTSLADASHGIGWADSADGTVPGLGTDTILVTFTLNGDANLDGHVGFGDLVLLAQHYGQSGMNWDQGDFNYDGKVSFSDLVILAGHYGQSLNDAPLSQSITSVGLEIQLVVGGLPEPRFALLYVAILIRYRRGGAGNPGARRRSVGGWMRIGAAHGRGTVVGGTASPSRMGIR